MFTFLTMFVQDEDGATMIEYGLMVGLIAVVCFGTVTALGQSLVPFFTEVNGALTE